MSLDWLQIADFRNLESVEIRPSPGINWFFGDNGAGKTSVLEAIHVLGRGRSFRSAGIGPVVRSGSRALRVVASVAGADHRLGVDRGHREWRGRIDGRDCNRVSAFARLLPLVLIDPTSHALVEGGPDVRRSYLDWGLFHVEPSYLEAWRRYARLLRQRNAALRDGGRDDLLDALETPMAAAAAEIDEARRAHIEQLSAEVRTVAGALDLRFPPPMLSYRPGQDPGRALESVLRSDRPRDRELGFTRAGPHRADLRLIRDGVLAAPRLSRGQQKLVSLLLLLGLLEYLRDVGRAPVLLLDDPVSELDRDHLDRVLGWLAGADVQAWLTAVEAPSDLECAMFHVEHGRVVEAP